MAITGFDFLFEAPGMRSSPLHLLTFFAGQSFEGNQQRCKRNIHSIQCVCDQAWPGLYHGMFERNLGEVGPDGQLDLGVMQFPAAVERVDALNLLLRYEVADRIGQGVCCSGHLGLT
ncbi:MAG: hypothetical protein D3923_15730 [Candidatus Electrothrix sp. AR3]|nr:hypothetical protein [Candidatus Electrothrix sp. AR3]